MSILKFLFTHFSLRPFLNVDLTYLLSNQILWSFAIVACVFGALLIGEVAD